jgi:membrane-associated phospholipid phosphatase
VARLAWRGRAIALGRPGARSEATRAIRGILRDGGPVILIMWLFQSLKTYTGVIRQTSIDGYLYRADLWLFGVEPTVWLSRHSTPLVTDYMALAYGSDFVTPMILVTFDSADPLRTRSAFPSLHCSLALLTLSYSQRFSDAVWPRHPRLWFRIVRVVVVSLWISVVYLRHHWVVDMFAGLAVGGVSNHLAPILRMHWPKLAH